MKKKYEKSFLLELLEMMYLGRKFEEKVQLLFSQGLVHGTAHLAIGEEATSVGSVMALKAQDYVFGTHRGHVQALAKGLDVNEVMAEILAKGTGVCKGLGGSMHIGDPEHFFYGTGGVLGASSVLSCGPALAIKKRNEKDRICVVFFGDGTFNQGATFEALNLASVWNLPLLLICINNTYGMSTHITKATKEIDLAKRAIPFGIPGKTVDGNDVLAVYEAVSEAREYVLENGPMLLVQNTYRISGHSKSDANLYRTKEEINFWKEKCPIKSFRAFLEKEYGVPAGKIDEIEQKTDNDIEKAVEFAKNSPDLSLEEAMGLIYA